jgi:hypothetical protein
MTDEQLARTEAELCGQLATILAELRPRVGLTFELLKKFLEQQKLADEAVRVAERNAQENGEPPPNRDSIPERKEMLETYCLYQVEHQVCCDIWDGAKRPLGGLAIISEQGERALAEARPLLEDPTPANLASGVDLLEILVKIAAPAPPPRTIELEVEKPKVTQLLGTRKEIFGAWKVRHPERGALTTLLEQIRLDSSDFRKWRKTKKFSDESEVTTRIVAALRR